MGLLGDIFSPIGRGFQAIGRGFNSAMDRGVQNSLSAIGVDPSMLTPEQRAGLRSQFMSRLGAGLQHGSLDASGFQQDVQQMRMVAMQQKLQQEVAAVTNAGGTPEQTYRALAGVYSKYGLVDQAAKYMEAAEKAKPPVPKVVGNPIPGAPIGPERRQMLMQRFDDGSVRPMTYNNLPLTAQPEKPQNIEQLIAVAVQDAQRRGVDPRTDPKVQQLVAAHQSTLKPNEPGLAEQMVALYSKPPDQLTPEQQARVRGFERYNDLTKVQPGVLRADAYAGARPVMIEDPNHPGRVIYAPAGEAMRSGAATPASIPFQAALGTSRQFASGNYSNQLTAINTARYHMGTFAQLAQALGNNNWRLLNSVRLAWKSQFGSEAPTNFALAKEAFTGEVARAFTASAATQGDRNKVEEAIKNSTSWAGLLGAARTADELLAGKQKALQQAYEAGMRGRPYFGDPNDPLYTDNSLESMVGGNGAGQGAHGGRTPNGANGLPQLIPGVTVVNGMLYIGGNPNDPSRWVVVPANGAQR